MRQFQVPQFITVEDKVIGPLTIKQFIYVGSGLLLIALANVFLQPFLFYPVAIILGAFAGALAFLKINQQPFPLVVKNALFYFLRPRVYVWKREIKKAPRTAEIKKSETTIRSIPKLSESKLSDLSWSLDIKDRTKE